MKYELILNAETDMSEKIYTAIKCEEAEKNRSSVKINKEAEQISFQISAKDVTALKASINHVLKILTVGEKTRGLVKNG